MKYLFGGWGGGGIPGYTTESLISAWQPHYRGLMWRFQIFMVTRYSQVICAVQMKYKTHLLVFVVEPSVSDFSLD